MALIAGIAATGAHVLIRAKTGHTGPKLPVLRRLGDGSSLSLFGGIQVRVVDAQITTATKTTTGSIRRATGDYRLVTTLLDHHRYPATEIVTLYHQRWEIETAYLELKSSRGWSATPPAGWSAYSCTWRWAGCCWSARWTSPSRAQQCWPS